MHLYICAFEALALDGAHGWGDPNRDTEAEDIPPHGEPWPSATSTSTPPLQTNTITNTNTNTNTNTDTWPGLQLLPFLLSSATSPVWLFKN